MGEVKPPFELAEGAAVAQAGRSLATFAGPVQDRLVQSQSAIEEAEFHSIVDTAMQDYDTVVAANPGWGFDKLQLERDRMMTRIEAAGQKATTGTAKRANANWLTRNKNLIFAKTQTSMQAIKSKQILAAYQVSQKTNMTNFDKPSYVEAKDNMVRSGMLNKEFADAQQVRDFAIMDDAQQKTAQAQVVQNLEISVTQTAAELGWQAAIDDLAKPETIAGLTQAGVSLSDAKQILTNMKAFATVQQEAQRETDRQQIVDLFVEGRFINIANRINATSLDANEKLLMIGKAEARSKAIADGKEDPYEVTDNAFYAELLRRGDYTKKELDDALGKGDRRGLSISVYNSLLKTIGDGSRATNTDYNHGINVLGKHEVNNGFVFVPSIGEKDPATGKKVTSETIAAAKAENLLEWSKSQARFDKFFDEFQEKNDRSPNADEINEWLETEMFPTFIETVTRGFWSRAFGRAGAVAEAIIVPGTVPIGLLPDIDIESLQSKIDNLSDEDRAALNELRSEEGTITPSEADNFLRQRGLD